MWSGDEIFSTFDNDVRRKPLVFAADAVGYGE
jgi:hypothetical protein